MWCLFAKHWLGKTTWQMMKSHSILLHSCPSPLVHFVRMAQPCRCSIIVIRKCFSKHFSKICSPWHSQGRPSETEVTFPFQRPDVRRHGNFGGDLRGHPSRRPADLYSLGCSQDSLQYVYWLIAQFTVLFFRYCLQFTRYNQLETLELTLQSAGW